MAIQVRQSNVGYDIITPTGGIFDLADVEAWRYVGLDERNSRIIVRGFPEYWQDQLGDNTNDLTAIELADNSRQESFLTLAHNVSLAPVSDDPWNPIEPWNPYADCHRNRFLGQECVYHGLKPYFSEMLTTELWGELARQCFDGLRKINTERPDCSTADESALRSNRRERQRLSDGSQHIRGPRLTDESTLQHAYSRTSENRLRWGPLCYQPDAAWLSHFCIAGMPRTGKTTLLRLLFQSLYTNFHQQVRFVLYDAKPDILPFLFPPSFFHGSRSVEEAESQFYLLNPFDARCTPWDIAADTPTSAKAREIANIIFPEPIGRENEYFFQASRDVATAAMNALRQQATAVGLHWTFYDLLCALQPENIETVLSSTADGRQMFQTYLTGDGAAPADLTRTLRTKTALCLPAAYRWSRSPRPAVSLRNWSAGDTRTIVLANNHDHFDAASEINRILLNTLLQQLLAVEQPPLRSFLYLDEFEHLGRIDRLARVGEMGADRGINLALAFHDLDMLARVYGRDTAGILGMCGFFAFLKVQNRTTAEWATGIIGSQEVVTTQRSIRSGDSQGEAFAEHRITRPLVMPDEVMNLPLFRAAEAIKGIFLAPPHNAYVGNLPASTLFQSTAADIDWTFGQSVWPAAEQISPYIPFEDGDPPDDTFASLYALGFRKPGYEPLREGADNSPVEASATDVGDQTANESSSDAESDENPPLEDYDFNWDFGDN